MKGDEVMKRSIIAVLLFSAAVVANAQVYELTATQNGETLGTMQFKLLPEIAPNHAAFMVARIAEKFYDGSAFHRVIPGFMIQGGDPHSKSLPRNTWGYGGYEEAVDAEFNSRPHVRGIMSAARTADPNSFRGQFFICVATAGHLDGQYTVFGEVISGMDVADKIVNAPRDAADNPIDKISMTISVVTSVDEEQQGPQTTINPQPVRSSMIITTEAPSKLTLMDLNGAVVLSTDLEGGVNALDVSQLSCGAYVVMVSSETGTRYRPVMIAAE